MQLVWRAMPASRLCDPAEYKHCIKSFRVQSRNPARKPCTCRLNSAISAKEEYVLAIDVGTSCTKAALISSTGAVAISSSAPHPAPTSSILGGQASAEQDPQSWWLATKSTVNTCLSKLLTLNHQLDTSFVQALAVTGQMQDVILVPQVEVSPQRKAILYSDARATLEANEVSHFAGGDGDLANLTGSKQGATSLLAKLRWLDRHEPEAFLECQGVLIGGAGAGSPGSLYAYIGTSGWVAGSFERSLQHLNKELLVPGVFTLAHPDPSLVFKTGSIMTAGGNVAWAASNLQASSKIGKTLWEAVNQQAAHAPPGSKGLLYLPYLNGERCPFEDPDARAAFIGISSSISAAEMYRSVMEGVSFALLSASEALSSSQEPGPLRLVGGGARSPIWPMILANVFGRTVDVLEDAQDVGVKGAALLAGKWLGWHTTLSPSDGWLRVKESVFPHSTTVAKYRELFRAYKTAYTGLQETFRLLSKYSEP